MAGQAYSGGAVEIFVELLTGIPQIPTGGGAPTRPTQIAFLGAGKVPTEPEITLGWGNVMNDLAGNVNPYDYCYMGARAQSAVELTLWVPSVLGSLQSIFPFLANSDGDLIWNDKDVGALVMTEGLWTRIYYRYMRRGVPAMQNQGMEPGRRYWGSRLLSMSERPGAKENSRLLVFGHQAIRSGNTWTLRDSDLSQILNLRGA